MNKNEYLLPRLIRLRNIPRYLGMDRRFFNKEVRPFLTEIPIGIQGKAFDRLDLDQWVDYYKGRSRRPYNKKVKIMGRKRTPGLYKRGAFWHIDKQVFGKRLCESTYTDSLKEVEKYLARRIENLRQVAVYGARPKRKFREAATKFLQENQQKKSIQSNARQLKILDKYIGDLPLEAVHIGALQPFVAAKKKDGRKNRTIDFGLQIVRHILNLAASECMDDKGLTWLEVVHQRLSYYP